MPTAAAGTSSVYQLRVVPHGVSPLIWRRPLVPGDASVADVHAVLQIAFGWDGEHKIAAERRSDQTWRRRPSGCKAAVSCEPKLSIKNVTGR